MIYVLKIVEGIDKYLNNFKFLYVMSNIFKKKKKGGGSVYSVASSNRRPRPVAREEIIGKRINDILREKEK